MQNRLAGYWPEPPAILRFDAAETAAPPEPAIFSFAEWAPRMRAAKAASSNCPCRTLPARCSVCRERAENG